jgi:hypothetical protein
MLEVSPTGACVTLPGFSDFGSVAFSMAFFILGLLGEAVSVVTVVTVVVTVVVVVVVTTSSAFLPPPATPG